MTFEQLLKEERYYAELEGIEKHTNPPLQYDESGLVKELEKLGKLPAPPKK